MTVCLRARYVFPVQSPPIQDGTITVCGDRIVDVAPQVAGAKTIDLGNVALIPGLVNAHTHLEFSDLVEPLEGAEASFTAWLQAVIQHRRHRPSDETNDRWVSLGKGTSECLETGTTLLGEIATGDWPGNADLPGRIECVVFRELIQRRAESLESKLEIARQHIAAGQRAACWQPGISPHAPYTTHCELVQRVAELSAETETPVAMHLAESPEEVELLAAHSGPLVCLLRDLDAWDPNAVPRGIEASDYLQMLAQAHRALIVHGNYLAGSDWDFLAARSAHMSVVYCPRTHDRFGHSSYPLAEMLGRGVRVCLGTDSRASNPDLNLFREIQHVALGHVDVSPADALRLGTLAGAEALGRDHEFGSIAAGKRANLLVLPLPEHQAQDPHELLLLSDETPRWIMGESDAGGLLT